MGQTDLNDYLDQFLRNLEWSRNRKLVSLESK